MHQSTMCEPTPPLSETQLDMQALPYALQKTLLQYATVPQFYAKA